MIRIALIVILGLSVVSCHTTKKVVGEQPKQEVETPQTNKHDDEIFYLGEVQILDCGTVIQISSGETNYKYSPINLESKFNVDKLRLKLKFRALDEKGTVCSEFKAIEIKEVFAVR